MSSIPGRIISEETKRKISKAHKGRKLSETHKQKLSEAHKGQIAWNKGKKLSDKHRQNLSEAHLGKIPWMKGKHHSKKTKKRMSESSKGQIAWNKGIPHSEKAKKRMSEALIGKGKPETSGEKHWNWKGGITPEITRRIDDPEWKVIRKRVYRRDNWTCQVCGKHCQGSDIQCHHIIPYRISKDNSDRNLIILCKSCHMKEERKYYISLKKGD